MNDNFLEIISAASGERKDLFLAAATRLWPRALAFWPAYFCERPDCLDRELLKELSRD
jgi:hypothetical protein